jgi:N-acetylmuramoyl-L-alanine amidase
VLDPGHGGTIDVGRSTPYGVRGINGLLEKNVTIDLARRVAERMGTSLCLTRYGDVNLSLSDRAQLSRDLGSPAFLSIHATAGGRGQHGSESWVHSHAGPASLALAEEVRGELSRIGIADRGLRRGDLAVLNPGRHRPGCAACLIEVEHLDDQEGARRLGNPRELDVVADGLARAVDRYLSRAARSSRSYAYGRPVSRVLADPLDLTDFPTNVFVVVPDGTAPSVPREIQQGDLDKLQTAWDCMMKGKGLTLEGSADLQQRCRELIRGGLADSPMVRALFQEIACDDTRPLTLHVRSKQPEIFIDAFRYDVTRPLASRANQPGHHTIDIHDFDQIPRVSGTPRNGMYLKHQWLVHALREARQGLLGNGYFPSHYRAIDDENVFRAEQGQSGTKAYGQPAFIGNDFRWDFAQGGTVIFSETWRMTGNDIRTIEYSP